MLVLIPGDNLQMLNVRPSLPSYLSQLWSRRHFIKAEARANAFSSGRDTYLGKLWIFLDPIFQVAFYGLVFGLILQVHRGMDNFVGFLVIGVVFFGFFSKGFNSGAHLIQRSRGLLSSFSFPAAAMVLSSSYRQFLDSLIPAVVSIGIALLFQLDKPVSWSILLVVPLFLLGQVFTLGVKFLIAWSTAFIPDLRSVFSLATRGLFFVSGVFFSIDRFDTNPTIRAIVESNPIYQFLISIRSCVLDGKFPDWDVWLYLSVWSIVTLIIGFTFFWHAEGKYTNVR